MNPMLPRPKFWAEAAEQKQTRFTLIGELLIFLVLTYLSAAGQMLLLAIPVIPWMFSEQSAQVMSAVTSGELEAVLQKLLLAMPDWILLCALFAYAAMGAIVIFYCRRFQRRTLASMGLRGKPLAEALLGFAVGLALFGAVLALGTGLGGFQPRFGSVSDGAWLTVLGALLGCLVQGAAMELLVRGYFAPSVGARVPVPYALLFSTLFSVLFQRSYAGVDTVEGINVLLLGLVLGVWVIKRGNLWSACTLHGAWIFAANFLFSFAPADQHEGIYLLRVDTDVFRTALTGGEAGPLASLCTTLVLLAALALALALRARDPAPVVPKQNERTENIL